MLHAGWLLDPLLALDVLLVWLRLWREAVTRCCLILVTAFRPACMRCFRLIAAETLVCLLLRSFNRARCRARRSASSRRLASSVCCPREPALTR